LPHPTPSAFRLSQPLDASIRPVPAGLVSCRIRSWGSPFRALLLSCSRAPVSRALSPPAVWATRRTQGPTPTNRRSCLGCAPASGSRSRRAHRAAPDFRVLLHTRVRHLKQRFRLEEARSSPGPSPLQGSLPRCDSSNELPLMRLALRARTTKGAPLQGLTRNGIGSPLSRSPTLLGFATS
jgi:hypothetical protein